MKTAAAHAIIAGAERSAAIDRDLRHRGRGHRLDHLGAVLDHAGFLVGFADHIAGGIVQIQDRRARLAAGLDEMRGLVGAGGIERAVVGDDADRLALDAGVAADGGGAVITAEFGEVGIVDDPRDHLTHVDGTLVVHRHDAQQFLGIVPRRTMRRCVRVGAVPLQIGHDVARDPQRVAVVFRKVIAEAGNAGVHLGAAEFLLGGDLAGRGLQERRPGQEGTGPPAHHHDVVGQPGLVGAARGRGAMRHRHHRQAGRRQPRQIAEDVAAAHKILDAVAQEIGAGAFDQLHVRQLVLQRQFLHPQRLVEAVGLQRAGIDAGIISADHAADAGDESDPGDQAAAGNALVGIGNVEAITRQRRKLDEGGAGIEHQRHPLARQQLPALVKAVLGRGRRRARPLLQPPHPRDQRQHAVAVGFVGRARRRDGGFKYGHGDQLVLLEPIRCHSGKDKTRNLEIPGSRFARPGMTVMFLSTLTRSSSQNGRCKPAAVRPCAACRSRSSAFRRGSG